MSSIPPSWIMLGLDSLMIIYTMWVLSAFKPMGRLGLWIGAGLAAWLGVLHIGLSSGKLFPEDISGPAFLAVILIGVAAVGVLLFFIPPVRRLLMGLDQRQLLLLQGVRVWFGAVFLMNAALGILPKEFGIVDGFTHVGAGFFGLVAAFCLTADIQGARRAWFANIWGLVDILIVASTLALVLLPEIGPHHSMMYAVFLPAPLWLWFHVISLWKLVRTEA